MAVSDSSRQRTGQVQGASGAGTAVLVVLVVSAIAAMLGMNWKAVKEKVEAMLGKPEQKPDVSADDQPAAAEVSGVASVSVENAAVG